MSDNGFDKFSKRIEKAARQYNEPPETPREVMWLRMLARRAERRVTNLPVSRPFWQSRRMWWPAVAAAILIVGIVIGRFIVTIDTGRIARGGQDTDSRTTDVSKDPALRSAFQLAAVPVLNQTELLLTQFRAGESLEDNGDSYSSRAAALLMDTRFLLDSPAAEDMELRHLLSDLELVLTQIVRIAAKREQEERDLINENISDRSLLPRLRANAPAGTFSSTI
jgi:hypothetical protein